VHAATRKLSTSLIVRSAIVPVAAAALLPLVAAGATQLPGREPLKIARGILLLSGVGHACPRSATVRGRLVQ
jgi:hypothetical protein